MTNLKEYIGNKTFYKKIATLAIPLSLQQLLGSAMEMIDSLMVSWIGMVSAVGSASQIIIIANTITWGILSGTNIFAAQYYGKKDFPNLKKVFGLSLIMTFVNALFWFTLITFFSEPIIRFFTNDEAIITSALKYINIARFSLLLEAVAFTFSYHYRSTDKANFTLWVSIISMITNITLNYMLIFGFGCIPAMNVEGAALATAISHSISILIYFVVGIKTKQCFLGSFKEMFSFEFDFTQHMFHRVAPLIVNETFFGFGNSLIIIAIGKLGSQSLEAYYIGDQIASFFQFIIWGFGGAVQIIISHELGQGHIKEAVSTSKKVMGVSTLLAIMLGSIILIASPLIMELYHIQSDVVASYTRMILMVFAARITFRFFNFTIFSILKSGGDSHIVTFLDCGIMYIVAIPLAFAGVYLFGIQNVALLYLMSQSEQLVRFILGTRRLHSGIWANDLTVIH